MTFKLITAALVGTLSLFPTVQATNDLNGTWTLDPARSTGAPPGAQVTMTVKQEDDRIEVATLFKGPNGEQQNSEVFVLNGKESNFKPPMPNSKGKRSVKWAENRTGFEVTDRVTIETPQGAVTINTVNKWQLSPKGDRLTIDGTTKTPQGERKSKRVFTRQTEESGQ